MSLDLYYSPGLREPDSLPKALKYVLGRRLWGEEVHLQSPPQTVDKTLIPYLEGLRDAGTDGAQRLIDLIEKYGSVRLWIDG